MKAHRTDTVSLTFALIFLALVGWWLAARFVDLPLPEVGWVVAAALILLGVLGLVSALRSGRNGRAEVDQNRPEPAGGPDEPDISTGQTPSG
jgi:hypothetical protein